MSIERLCRVVRIEPDQVWLSPAQSSCEGCGGCGGRCALFAGSDTEVALSHAQIDGTLAVGSLAIVSLAPASLRREAAVGYGLPLTGLLAGAIAGWFASSALPTSADVGTALGAVAGTLLGLRASKRRSPPVCRARASSDPAG